MATRSASSTHAVDLLAYFERYVRVSFGICCLKVSMRYCTAHAERKSSRHPNQVGNLDISLTVYISIRAYAVSWAMSYYLLHVTSAIC